MLSPSMRHEFTRKLFTFEIQLQEFAKLLYTKKKKDTYKNHYYTQTNTKHIITLELDINSPLPVPPQRHRRIIIRTYVNLTGRENFTSIRICIYASINIHRV